MRWLNFGRNETREQMLTVRITPTCFERINKIIKFVHRTQGKKISKADLIERLVDEAWKELEKTKGK